MKALLAFAVVFDITDRVASHTVSSVSARVNGVATIKQLPAAD